MPKWLQTITHPLFHGVMAAATYAGSHVDAITALLPPKVLPFATALFGLLAAFGVHLRTSNGTTTN